MLACWYLDTYSSVHMPGLLFQQTVRASGSEPARARGPHRQHSRNLKAREEAPVFQGPLDLLGALIARSHTRVAFSSVPMPGEESYCCGKHSKSPASLSGLRTLTKAPVGSESLCDRPLPRGTLRRSYPRPFPLPQERDRPRDGMHKRTCTLKRGRLFAGLHTPSTGSYRHGAPTRAFGRVRHCSPGTRNNVGLVF